MKHSNSKIHDSHPDIEEENVDTEDKNSVDEVHDSAGKSRGRTPSVKSVNTRKKIEFRHWNGDIKNKLNQEDEFNNDRDMLTYASGAAMYNNQTPMASNMGSTNLREALLCLEQGLKSNVPEVQLDATKQIRQLLSMERDSLVQDVLGQNVVPQLLEFLKNKEHEELQVEALWALTNIAAGTTEHTHLLIQNNAVPTLVSLLDYGHNFEVLEQAVWVLGNIAGDGLAARDTVLSAGALKPLLRCMNENKKVSLLRIATWTLSNLCDGQPRPIIDVPAVLITVGKVIHAEDTEILSHACWALSHLCDGPSPHIQAVVDAGVCERLVALLNHKSWRVVKPALRTVGNIVCAEDDQDYTQHIIEHGAVPWLRQLIDHSNREIQKEACWTLSNIAAGTVSQIQCVLDSGSIPPLVKLASLDINTDPDVKIEACWVLLNATSCGSDSQIEVLVEEGCVGVLCNLLEDTSMVMMALEGLEKILQVGDELALNSSDSNATNPHAPLLDTSKVEALKEHRSTQISKRATRMWKHHFVVCAICKKAYSLHSSETKFCNECKCNVCKSCDCSVFHLSYQDKLWRELAEGEAEKEKTKKESKKSKRQKKRLKDKKKKELLKKKDFSTENNNSERVDSNVEQNSTAQKQTNAEIDTIQDSSIQIELIEDEHSGDTLLDEKMQALNDTKQGNDELVDFLMESGSILELARMIDMEYPR